MDGFAGCGRVARQRACERFALANLLRVSATMPAPSERYHASPEPFEVRRRGGAARRRTRRGLAGLMACVLAAQPVAPAMAQDLITTADYETCRAQDDGSFRQAIEGITVKALQKGIAGLDYKALVADEWRKGGVDELIDRRVDLAVAEVRSETSWANLLQSLADAEQAQKLATAVAERVYRSDAVIAGVEGLAMGVGISVGKSIELASVDAAGPALMCLQAFLGPRYGASVSRAVIQDAGKEFGLDPSKSNVDVSSGAVLRQSGGGITGAALILVRRQLAGLAQRVGQRLVGSVLSRLVSVAAGGVGLVLIAKDVWDLRHGVMPIIAAEMKSPENKVKVQEELARTMSEQIGEHVREIGIKSADRVIEIWSEFRRNHAKVLEIAERSAPFKQFVESVRTDGFARLNEVVGMLLPAEGEAGLLKRLDDGTLNTAVNVMPAEAMEIARDTRSVADALGWSALTGGALGGVIEHQLHKRAKPEDFTAGSLQRLLQVGDRLSVGRLASISKEARDTLFALDTAELKALTKSLSETELGTLARYLSGLQAAPRERVLRAVAASAGSMQALASSRVREAIISSRDQSAAVDMMLRAPGFDPVAVASDARLVWDGRVNPLLMWERHPAAVGAAGFAALLLVLMVMRLLRPRRRARPPASTPPAATPPASAAT